MAMQTLTEEQMVSSVRNALLVAGQEMGNGDQWPVIKDTIHNLMKDWEAFKIERNVDAELKIHLYAQIDKIEATLPECTAAAQEQLRPMIKEWREMCDAYFDEVDPKAISTDEDNIPMHIKRMNSILATLEDSHD